MDAAVVVALIALGGTVGNVGLTYSLNARAERRRTLARADAQWARQRRSLEMAADDLAARIGNILEGDFLSAYGGDSPRIDEAILSTLFRFSNYFAWSEAFRRLERDPDLRHADEAQMLADRRLAVAATFQTDSPYGPGAFMVWREAQRAVGELMIRGEGEVIDTVGVADFLAEFEKYRPWLHRMERLIREKLPEEWPDGERARLAAIQSGLLEFRPPSATT